MTTADAIEYFEKRKLILASINLPGLESCEKALEALRLMQEIEQMKPLVIEAVQTAELHQMMQEFQKQKPTICVANGVTFATDINDGCKWIPTDERLPEHGDVVLCHHKHFDCQVICQWDKRSNVWLDDKWTYGTGCITHWMPLPEPPKEE